MCIRDSFETKEMIPDTEVDFLSRLSWMGLSKLLSRGVLTSIDGDRYRPIGLKESGELELIGVESKCVLQDLDSVGWTFSPC